MKTTSDKLFSELFVRLLDDVIALTPPKGADSPPVLRRSYVRAVFALIEGSTFAAKQFALDGLPDQFTTAEQALLREEEYSLDDQGRARTRTARLACRANIRLGFAALAKSCDVDHVPKFGGQGWENLCTAITIRDRLMHPKKIHDLDVTDEDMAVVVSAFQWFVASQTLCLKEMIVGMADNHGFEIPEAKKLLESMTSCYQPYSE